jgi:uncharacterized membrane protein
MGSAVLIVTFDDQEKGDRALKQLEEWQKQKEIELGDAVVIVKDEDGEVKIHETSEFTTKRGAIAGGAAGLVIGLMVGGPIGGLLLGAAGGGLAGKAVDLGIKDEEIAAVSDSMENATSAIAAQIKSVKHREMIAAAIRQSGGHVHELSIAEDTLADLENKAHQGFVER